MRIRNIRIILPVIERLIWLQCPFLSIHICLSYLRRSSGVTWVNVAAGANSTRLPLRFVRGVFRHTPGLGAGVVVGSSEVGVDLPRGARGGIGVATDGAWSVAFEGGGAAA